MWPWGHLAVGYLAWSLLARGAYRRPPRTSEALVVIVGTQFPDLVDKTLAWSLALLPSGRSLAHSLFTLAAVSAIALCVTERYGRPTLGFAFAAAYTSHLVSDAVVPILTGDLSRLGYFLWPITPAPPGDAGSILLFVQSVSLADFDGYHGVAILLCFCVWVFDGAPGVPRRPTAGDE